MKRVLLTMVYGFDGILPTPGGSTGVNIKEVVTVFDFASSGVDMKPVIDGLAVEAASVAGKLCCEKADSIYGRSIVAMDNGTPLAKYIGAMCGVLSVSVSINED